MALNRAALMKLVNEGLLIHFHRDLQSLVPEPSIGRFCLTVAVGYSHRCYFSTSDYITHQPPCLPFLQQDERVGCDFFRHALTAFSRDSESFTIVCPGRTATAPFHLLLPLIDPVDFLPDVSCWIKNVKYWNYLLE